MFNTDKNNDSEQKGSSIDRFIATLKDYLEKLVFIISTSYAVTSIIFNYYNTINQANFYGIPVNFFIDDQTRFSMSKPLIGLVTVLLFAFPLLYKLIFKDKKISKYSAVLFSFAISLAIIYLNFESVFSFIYSSIFRAVLVVLFFAIILPFILYRTFSSLEIIESDEKQNIIKNLSLIQILIGILLGILISWVLYVNVFKTDKLDEGYMSIIKDKEELNSVDVIVKNIGYEKAVLMKGEINDGELKLMKFNYWIDNISGRRIDYAYFDKITPDDKIFKESSDNDNENSEEKIFPKERNEKNTDDNNSDMLSGYKNHSKESLDGKNVIIINNNFYEHNKDGFKDVKEFDSNNHGEMRDEFRK